MVNVMSNSGHTGYGIKQYVIDTPDDLDYLPINIPAGSTAFCISTSAVYMINSSGEWVEI